MAPRQLKSTGAPTLSHRPAAAVKINALQRPSAAGESEERVQDASVAASKLRLVAGRTGNKFDAIVHEHAATLYLVTTQTCEASALARTDVFADVCLTVDGVLAVLNACATKPTLFARTAHLMFVANRLLLTVHAATAANARLPKREKENGERVTTSRHEEWLTAVRGLRRRIAQSGSPPKDSGVSPSLLNLQLTQLECAIMSLSDPDRMKRLAKSGANFVVGIGKAVLAGGVPNAQVRRCGGADCGACRAFCARCGAYYVVSCCVLTAQALCLFAARRWC